MDFLNSYSDWGLLALRLAVGAIFLIHGQAKWKMWKTQPNEQMKSSMLLLMRLLSIAEPLGGIALVAGVWTKAAALGLGIVMIGALYFKLIVWKSPFTSQSTTGWELDLILLAANLMFLTNGPGVYSLDQWLR